MDIGLEKIGQWLRGPLAPVGRAQRVGQEVLQMWTQPDRYSRRLSLQAAIEAAQTEQALDTLQEKVGDVDTKRRLQEHLCLQAAELLRIPADTRPQADNSRLQRIGETLGGLQTFSPSSLNLEPADALQVSVYVASLKAEPAKQ